MTKTTLFAALLSVGAFAPRAAAQNVNPDRKVNPETLVEVRNLNPRETGRDDPALLLAQALVAEAGWTLHDDHKAIPWVIVRRATLPAFRRAAQPEVEVLLRYVSAFRCFGRACDTERMGRMRSLSWAVLDARAPEIARLARAWFEGERHNDPCPGAWHWGSHADGRGSPLPIVSCGRTTNLFLGEPSRMRARPLDRSGGTVSASAVKAGLRRKP
jgi:hypothetical protein